jgi:GT2 family glycosyltransferase
VVLNYNGRGSVEDAVRSLLEQDLPVEVVVVDNGSTDGSDADLERAFGNRVRVLRAGRNLGWGGGNNLGIAATRGAFVLLLNDDAVAEPGFARALVTAAESDPRVGMVAARVRDHVRRDRLDTVGHLMYPDGLNRGRGRGEADHGQYDGCRTALFPSGAAALYRRAMLDEIGSFDERFFLYGDDAELGLRGRLAGWGCALAAAAIAYHRYSRSAGPYSTLKAFYVERNRVLVLLKLLPLRLVALSPFYTAARLALQAWGALNGRGAAARLAAERSMFHLVAVTLRAWADALRLAPAMLRERRRLRTRRALTSREFLRLLDDFRLKATEAALRD